MEYLQQDAMRRNRRCFNSAALDVHLRGPCRRLQVPVKPVALLDKLGGSTAAPFTDPAACCQTDRLLDKSDKAVPGCGAPSACVNVSSWIVFNSASITLKS